MKSAEEWALVLQENMSADEWNEWDLLVVADLIANVQRDAGAAAPSPDGDTLVRLRDKARS